MSESGFETESKSKSGMQPPLSNGSRARESQRSNFLDPLTLKHKCRVAISKRDLQLKDISVEQSGSDK